MTEEGYIKYKQHWEQHTIPEYEEAEALIVSRDELYKKGWVGVYPDGIGYGNISVRITGTSQCLITATQTGRFRHLTREQVCRIQQIDIANNSLWCDGLLPASSEAMSHMAIYQVRPDAHCVIHIHDAYIWKNLLGLAPTVDVSIPYGSPDMAYALQELVLDFADWNEIIVTAGHKDGLFVCGSSPEEALEVLNNWSGTYK